MRTLSIIALLIICVGIALSFLYSKPTNNLSPANDPTPIVSEEQSLTLPENGLTTIYERFPNNQTLPIAKVDADKKTIEVPKRTYQVENIVNQDGKPEQTKLIIQSDGKSLTLDLKPITTTLPPSLSTWNPKIVLGLGCGVSTGFSGVVSPQLSVGFISWGNKLDFLQLGVSYNSLNNRFSGTLTPISHRIVSNTYIFPTLHFNDKEIAATVGLGVSL